MRSDVWHHANAVVAIPSPLDSSAISAECRVTEKRVGWKTISTFVAMPLSLVLAVFFAFVVVFVPVPAPITRGR